MVCLHTLLSSRYSPKTAVFKNWRLECGDSIIIVTNRMKKYPCRSAALHRHITDVISPLFRAFIFLYQSKTDSYHSPRSSHLQFPEQFTADGHALAEGAYTVKNPNTFA